MTTFDKFQMIETAPFVQEKGGAPGEIITLSKRNFGKELAEKMVHSEAKIQDLFRRRKRS